MDWNWENFEHGPVEGHAERVYVTVNRRGNFFFNRRALEAMGEPDAVTMMFDRRRSTIGIRRSPIDQKSAFRLKLKERSRSQGRMLYASNFCRLYHIRPDETLRFTGAEVNKDGILILDLNEVQSVKKL